MQLRGLRSRGGCLSASVCLCLSVCVSVCLCVCLSVPVLVVVDVRDWAGDGGDDGGGVAVAELLSC